MSVEKLQIVVTREEAAALLLLSFPAKNDRVPHISLVFREMWDTTVLDV